MQYLGAGLLALLLVALAILATRRRTRYRRLATKLHAKHVDAGPFVPGSIRGDGFEIEARAANKRYRTRVHVSVPTPPGTFVLRPGFFGRVPSWSHAVFPGSEQQRAGLLRWLGPDAMRPEFPSILARAGIREIVVGGNGISTQFVGIVDDVDRLRHALEALGALPSVRAPHRMRA